MELASYGIVKLSDGEQQFVRDALGCDCPQFTTPIDLERFLEQGQDRLRQSGDLGDLAEAFIQDLLVSARALTSGGRA